LAQVTFPGGVPNAVQIHNTIGDGSADGVNDIAWGLYGFPPSPLVYMTNGPFTSGKTIVMPSGSVGGGQYFAFYGDRISATQCYFSSIRPSDNSSSLSYALNPPVLCEIRIYR
jgi:hypothetical protein